MSEIWAGPFCDSRESAKSTVKSVSEEGHTYLFCYAFERMNTSKRTEIERTGKSFFLLFCMYQCTKLLTKCEDSNNGASVV